MMKSALLAASLLVLTMLAACGKPTTPGSGSTSESGAAGGPDPFAILAALRPEARPYGLDVYTAKCASCHGDLGQGIDANPALSGVKRAAMYQRLLDYRAGKAQGEHASVMEKAVAGLSDAEIAAVSIYAGE
jgi:cytochrome c553